MAINQSEKVVIKGAIKRLRGHRTSRDVLEKLQLINPFLEMWVIGPLEALIKEDRNRRDLQRAREMMEI